jgi:Na+/melibiose symporter-like transporter
MTSINPSSTSLGTSVLKSCPPTSHGVTPDSCSLSSTQDRPSSDCEKLQLAPPSLTISPATPTHSGDETPSSSQHKLRQDAPNNNDEEEPFSVFTPFQKNLIAFAASLAALFSTLSSFIYYPALTRISSDLGVSLMLVQLTITSYLVVAGVAPAFMGDMADRGGRRPVYVLMFCLMVGANVGIAVVKEWAGLLVLRMVQSAGSSGTFPFPLPCVSSGYW